jgi:hypothetical protein
MAGLQRWSVFLTVEGAEAGDYEPPLPDELQAALSARLAASVQFRPSVLELSPTRRHYRLEAALDLTADDLARGLAQELAERLAHAAVAPRIVVEVDEEGGEGRAREVVEPRRGSA